MPRLAGPDARALFAGARTATLGSTGADGPPHLVPCVFAVDGDQVYRAGEGNAESPRAQGRRANLAARRGLRARGAQQGGEGAGVGWVRGGGGAASERGRGERGGGRAGGRPVTGGTGRTRRRSGGRRPADHWTGWTAAP